MRVSSSVGGLGGSRGAVRTCSTSAATLTGHRPFFCFFFFAQYAFIRRDAAFLAVGDILRRRLGLEVVGVFPPTMLPARRRTSISACKVLISACLALMALEISLMLWEILS